MEVKVGDYLTVIDSENDNNGAVCRITDALVGYPNYRCVFEHEGVIKGTAYLSVNYMHRLRPSTDAEILKAKLFGL